MAVKTPPRQRKRSSPPLPNPSDQRPTRAAASPPETRADWQGSRSASLPLPPRRLLVKDFGVHPLERGREHTCDEWKLNATERGKDKKKAKEKETLDD